MNRARHGYLLKGGDVLDGSASSPTRLDVRIQGTRIVEMGRSLTTRAGEVAIDTRGLIVTPGFIDVHSHADNAPLAHADRSWKLAQGVTTEVVGNCGVSLAPRVGDGSGDTALLRTFGAMPLKWESMEELFDYTQDLSFPTNIVQLVGMGNVRAIVCGDDSGAATEGQQVQMRALLTQALRAGCVGASSGLVYAPGMFANRDELVFILNCGIPDLLYATHMRDEGSQVRQSLAEAVEISRRSGARLQVSHLKVASRSGWGSGGELLGFLDSARESGVRIAQDVYPYLASAMSMDVLLPKWALAGGVRQLLMRLRSGEMRARIERELSRRGDGEEWESLLVTAGYDGVTVGSTASGQDLGKSLADLAREEQKSPFDVLVDLLLREDNDVKMVAHSMAEEDLCQFLAHPMTMVGSDGAAPGSSKLPHPRLAGTFPRFLGRYVRDQGVLDFPEAIRRITSLPAEVFKIPMRGELKEGNYADVVAFDVGAIADLATFESPLQQPRGIEHVFVNGRWTVRHSEVFESGAGRRVLASRIQPPVFR